MNKLEKSIITGIKNSLTNVTAAKDGDTWEKYAQRCQSTIQANVSILYEFLKIDAQPDKKSENSITLD